MSREKLERQEIRFCWGFIQNNPASPYFIVAKRLQHKGFVAIGKYSVENWQSRDDSVAINATRYGLQAMRAVTQSPEFSVIYELAMWGATAPDHIFKARLASSNTWDDETKKRVEGTELQLRAQYLRDLAEARAREEDKKWLYTDESQAELKSEAGEASAKARELLPGLSPITASEFPQLLEGVARNAITLSTQR